MLEPNPTPFRNLEAHEFAERAHSPALDVAGRVFFLLFCSLKTNARLVRCLCLCPRGAEHEFGMGIQLNELEAVSTPRVSDKFLQRTPRPSQRAG